MIEPVSDDLTIPINPRLSANRLMMISGALPSVAFSKRPQRRPEVLGQGLGRVAHQPGQRNDRQRRRGEHQDRVELQTIECDRDRDEDQQPVQFHRDETPRLPPS